MNSKLGWFLVAVAFAAGGWYYGWQGLVMAFTVTVFWLLLQFGRALRVMKNAAEAPVGLVTNAVMFQARLRPGLGMLQVVGMTKSLGRRQGDSAANGATRLKVMPGHGDDDLACGPAMAQQVHRFVQLVKGQDMADMGFQAALFVPHEKGGQ